MAKKKPIQEQAPETEMMNPFVGGEEDDLMDMEYVQDETTVSVDTHPPSTKEEAEALAEGKEVDEVDDPTPPEDAEAPKEEAEAPKEEAEEEEPVAEEPVAEEPDIKVPKDRFDEVNERMKKAERETKLLKEQLEDVVKKKSEPEPEPFDYAAKEKEAMDAVLEGDTDRYAALRAEIRDAERGEFLREARELAAQGDQQLQESLTFEEAGARIEQQFPEFVEDSEAYNPAAREDMLDLYVGYAQSGKYSRVEALQRAAERTAKLFGLGAKDEPAPDNVVAMKQPSPKAKAAAANAQPPVMESKAQGTNEEPRRDINSMSDEEYEALPESTKRRMRGDVL
ncbi:MAG: hypothetical protein HKP37_01285 [Boseongicola sp.]|nr:hypothetical protein [Boseongicola sp.]